MPKLSDVKVRRYPKNRDFWEVVGGGESFRTMSHANAKMVAGARRRVILKHALRAVGVKKVPRSLNKETKKGL